MPADRTRHHLGETVIPGFPLGLAIKCTDGPALKEINCCLLCDITDTIAPWLKLHCPFSKYSSVCETIFTSNI